MRTLDEQERAAYISGDVETAHLLARVADNAGEIDALESQIDALERQIDDAFATLNGDN